MSENDEGSAVRNVFVAFAVGAFVGAGLALLFAPQSGKETRELVSRKARDLKDAAGNAIERGKHLAGEVKQKAREMFDRSKEAAETSDANA